MAVGPINDESQGNARSISQQALFDASPRSVGLAPVAAPQEGEDAARLHRQTAISIGFLATHHVHLSPLVRGLEETGSFPLLKAVMGRRTGGQFSGQGILLDASTQHIHDGFKGLALLDARPFSLDLFPQLITYLPRTRSHHDTLSPLSLFFFIVPHAPRFDTTPVRYCWRIARS
jgi:hypothetical protein